MDPKIQKELEDFNIKKESVFKNIHLLNNLSESLVNSIVEEEANINEKKKKDIIEYEKRKTANELELLGIENSKMESYLDILSKKQDLEMKYLEQMCEQRAKIHKLGEKYSFIDVNSFISYENNYDIELNEAKHQHTKKKNSKKNTKEIFPETEKKEPEQNSNNYSTKAEENLEETNRKTDFDLARADNVENFNSLSPEPPPSRPPPPPATRRSTVCSPEGIYERTLPRRLSLEDQLRSALASKFTVPVDGKSDKKYNDDNSDSDESSSNWT